MKRVMNSVSVETNNDGDVVISQRWNDLNESDPEITISLEQAPLLASWILEAAETAPEGDSHPEVIPVKFWARGPAADSEELTVYNNAAGMIILKIDDDTFIEIAPAMAKRLREQLSRAITSALTDMFRPDAEA